MVNQLLSADNLFFSFLFLFCHIFFWLRDLFIFTVCLTICFGMFVCCCCFCWTFYCSFTFSERLFKFNKGTPFYFKAQRLFGGGMVWTLIGWSSSIPSLWRHSEVAVVRKIAVLSAIGLCWVGKETGFIFCVFCLFLLRDGWSCESPCSLNYAGFHRVTDNFMNYL